MYKKIKVKNIVKMLNDDFSQRDIEKALSVSRNSVSRVIEQLEILKIPLETILSLNDEELYSLLFPTKFNRNSTLAKVNYEYIESELKKVGVTLKLLHEEYKDKCLKEGLTPCSYAKFCRDFNQNRTKKGYTSHFTHKPGYEIEVDYSGPTMHFYSGDTKRIVYLFVATLPYSQYSYVEPLLSMDQVSFLQAHINMFNFFKGSPVRLTCDNLKTGVIEHPKQGEIVLNNEYLSLAEYYNTAIIPTGVKKPKEKPSVEGTVGKIATAIIAKLRNNTYTSFESLKYDINNALYEFNSKPFQKRAGSRESVYKNEELIKLRPLPKIEYEVCDWDYGHKVSYNSHICFKKNWYSVPYKYIKEMVDIKYNKSDLYIYYKSELIAKHSLFLPGIKNEYSTDTNHLDKNKTFKEWTYDSILKEALNIGEATFTVIVNLFNQAKIKEQAFDSALAIIKLNKAYSKEVIEKASKEALKVYSVPRFTNIKSIILTNQEKNSKTKNENKENINLRGSNYYKEK